MLTKIYRVKGRFVLGSEVQVFTKEFKAVKEEDIEEKSIPYSEANTELTEIKSKLNQLKKFLLMKLKTTLSRQLYNLIFFIM